MWVMNDGQLPRCDVCGAVLEETFSLQDHLHREPPRAPELGPLAQLLQMKSWVGEYVKVSRWDQRLQGRRHRRH
jgi:hypothetical protein